MSADIPSPNTHKDLGFHHEMPGVSANGDSVKELTPRHEGLQNAQLFLGRLREIGGQGAVADAVVQANQPNIEKSDTKFLDQVGILDATEIIQPRIIRALQTADRVNPDVLTEAFSEMLESGVDVGALEDVVQSIEDAERSPETTANYQGNWMQLQQDRMSSQDFLRKFDRWVQVDELSASPDPFGNYRHETPDEIAKQRQQITSHRSDVYGQVGIGRSELFGKKPQQLGTSRGYGEPGVVFADATHGGNVLTGRQKDLIAAHEVHHGLVKPSYGFQDELRLGIDTSSIASIDRKNRISSKYLSSGHEIIARMAQLKNYYGMKEGEVFTKDHLDYARSNYIQDTGVDNNMTEFFAMITNQTEQKFLDNMNAMPI